MRLLSFVLSFWLLRSVGSVSARWETGLDGDLYGEIPRPTLEPLLYRDEYKHQDILMETRLGYQRNRTSRRNLALGERQVCDPLGHKDSTHALISLLAILATSSRVPPQEAGPVAPRSILYVARFPIRIISQISSVGLQHQPCFKYML